MSKSARTTKASFVYENTSTSTVGEGLLRAGGGGGSGCLEPGGEQKQFGVGRAGGGVWCLTAEGLLSFGSAKGRVGGGRGS